MLQRWKAYIFPAADGGEYRWCRTKASLLSLLVLSFVLVCYSAVSSGGFWWSGPDCAQASVRFSGGPAPTNLSHIVFGIGGSARTWQQRRSYTELWWRPGEMRGHVWLDEEPAKEQAWPGTCPPYRVSADASRFGARAAPARMARIVAEAYWALGKEDERVRWLVMGDDDTVFFPENLVAVLGKYDHQEMRYVGAPSESVEQDVMHSYGMAFGGGGFALSRPAAAALAGVIDGCLDRYNYFYGSDQRVQSCLSELGVPLTREPGFHQVDIRGDAYGMLAAHPVAPLVSLHHLDNMKPISPHGGTQIEALRPLVEVSRFDPARLIQQCFCYESGRGYKWSVSVSWGYTVQLYPWVLAPKDLEIPLQTFRTWRSFSDGPFTFNTRPLKPDPCEQPLMFFLGRVQESEGSVATMTEYSRNESEAAGWPCDRPGFNAALKVEAVMVFAPRMDPTAWSRAPRRQCCRTRRTGKGKVLEVRIRHCDPGEITSPP